VVTTLQALNESSQMIFLHQ